MAMSGHTRPAALHTCLQTFIASSQVNARRASAAETLSRDLAVRRDDEQHAAILHQFRVLRANMTDPAARLGVDRREQFHYLDDAHGIAFPDLASDLDKGRGVRGRCTIEG